MTPEQDFAQLVEDVKTIKSALIGNELLNDGGLVKRMKVMEDKQDKFDESLEAVLLIQNRWKWFAAGASAIATLIGWVVNILWF